MARGYIKIDALVDPQQAHDQAVAMEAAWRAFAEKLREMGHVCEHPAQSRERIEGAVICRDCDRIVG